jgi:hypothetical protein
MPAGVAYCTADAGSQKEVGSLKLVEAHLIAKAISFV